MQIVRYRTASGQIQTGLLFEDQRLARADLALHQLLRLTRAELQARIATIQRQTASERIEPPPLAPIDGETEVWAAGVTYKRSVEARVEESETPDIYTRVYSAPRPELFFKATPRRVAGPQQPI
ncbi:MAG: hypothetical protein J2P37_11665, partial [Ktedonobacteraceae bacterium]|nr:hypothetical protein [Ktedonobacteraceae bacterium]